MSNDPIRAALERALELASTAGESKQAMDGALTAIEHTARSALAGRDGRAVLLAALRHAEAALGSVSTPVTDHSRAVVRAALEGAQ